ncbi:17597_t:CDS:2, partial [Funneliformis caledonium]
LKIAISSNVYPTSQPFKIEHDPIEEGTSSINIMHCKKVEDIAYIESDSHISSENEENHNTYFIKKRKRIDHYRKPNEEIIDSDQSSNSSNDNEDSVNEDLVDEKTDEEYMLNEDVSVDLFTAPNFDDFDDRPSLQTDNYDDSWILLWIFKYQERFQLSDIALNVLIRFFDLVLKGADSRRFKNFPSITYMTCKLFDIKKNQKYLHHPMQSQRKPCRSELLKKFPAIKGHVWHPKMIYTLPSLKIQL